MGSRVQVVPRCGIVELHRGQEQLLLGFADADFIGSVLTGKLGATRRDAKNLDTIEPRPLVARRSRARGAEPSPRTSILVGAALELCGIEPPDAAGEFPGCMPDFTGTKPNSEDGPKSLPGRETPMLRPRGCGEILQPGAVS